MKKQLEVLPNLIGISGKAGAGKDLVANIIQALTSDVSKCTKLEILNDIIKNNKIGKELSKNFSSYKNIKFADKLKDIVCLLIGCTRRELENRDFKEKELGEEWWYYTEGLSDIHNELVPYNNANKYIHNSTKWFLIKTTPRHLLQTIGTNLFRNQLHQNIWVNATFASYKSAVERLGFTSYSDRDIKDGFTKKPKWIISDIRFPNEVKAIKDRGGIIIMVERPCKECGGTNYHKIDCNIGRLEHTSEKALDNYKDWDIILHNNGSIENLITQIKEKLSL